MKKQEGFSLVEVVIALGVMSILALAVMMFTISSLGNYSAASTRGQMTDQAQLALDVMNNDILLSASADQNNRVEDPNAPGGNLLGWNASSTTLILATAAEDSAGNILFSDPAQYISHKNNSIYYLNGNSLYKRTLAADIAGNKAVTTCPPTSSSPTCPPDVKLLDNIASFSVRYFDGNNTEVSPPDARSVEASVTLQDRKYGQDISVDYTTRMVFRND